MDSTIVELLIGPVSGLAAGWIMAKVFKEMYEEKDKQLLEANQTTLKLLKSEVEECHSRSEKLMERIMILEKKVS